MLVDFTANSRSIPLKASQAGADKFSLLLLKRRNFYAINALSAKRNGVLKRE